MYTKKFVILLLFAGLIQACGESKKDKTFPYNPDHYISWTVAGGDNANSQYSSLQQINKSNVQNLEVAWVYRTGDKSDRSTIQANPVIIGNRMYISSPALKIIALNAETGEELWTFDAGGPSHANRGVTYWTDGNEESIFFTRGFFLYALDANTGKPLIDFGEDGRIDLREGLNREPAEELSISPTSPGIIYNDLYIIGGRVPEGPQRHTPGHVRAFDVRTGEIKWIFHSIPHPGEYGYDTWPGDSWEKLGGANNWGGMSLDDERGVVYVPLGSPSYDFYGGDRIGKNLYGNAIVALNATTGELIWYFQTTHHDIWDYDLSTPPNLLTVYHDGQFIDAVAQVTKTGMVFVLNRDTGESLFPIENRPVPPSTLLGEQTWPTQPFPVKPEPFSMHGLTEDDLTDLSPEKNAWAREQFRKYSSRGIYDPPSTSPGTIIMPGLHGGAWWGGAAHDPSSGIMYVNANNIPYVMPMVETESLQLGMLSFGEQLYTAHCAVCHGFDREGVPPFPELLNIGENISTDEAASVIVEGRGAMAPLSLNNNEVSAIISFLYDIETKENAEIDAQTANIPPYVHRSYYQFRDEEGFPAIKPPWGTLNAIDLNKGEILWQVPLGEYKQLTERGIPPTGTQNLGGPVVTAGGLIFIAATRDRMFRAFDKDTGEILWETELETGAFATPSTYEINGKQYVVIGVGGNCLYCGQGHRKLVTEPGDSFVVFALPDN